MRQIRIGAGAGYSGDRIEPAIELAEKGGLQYLIFRRLAERTIALAQQAKLRDPPPAMTLFCLTGCALFFLSVTPRASGS